MAPPAPPADHPTAPDRPPPVLQQPAELVPARTLAAEACASVALALAQSPALWASLHTLGLMLETQDAHAAEPSALGAALADLIAGADLTTTQAAQALALVEAMDSTARNWAALAYPGSRVGTASVPMLGIVA